MFGYMYVYGFGSMKKKKVRLTGKYYSFRSDKVHHNIQMEETCSNTWKTQDDLKQVSRREEGEWKRQAYYLIGKQVGKNIGTWILSSVFC